MRTSLAITTNTFREAIRQPVYWAVVILTAVLMALSAIFAGFTLGEESRLVRDAGLTSITIAGLLLAIFLSSSVVADEIDKKTALSVLCKPVHRYQFILGKYYGIFFAILAGYILLTIMLFVTVWWYESPIKYTGLLKAYWAGQALNPNFIDSGYTNSYLAGKPVTLSVIASLLNSDISYFIKSVFANLAKGVFLSLCEVAILTSAALAVSTRVSMVLNVCLTFSLFILGHQVGYLMRVLTGAQDTFMANLVHRVVPNFELLNYASDFAFDKVVPITLVGQLAFYAVGWIAIFLLIAIALFDQREIA